MNKLQAAEQLRRALQIFADTLSEEQAVEIPMIYDTWKDNTAYTSGRYIAYGVNSVGDPQLYRVIQAHTSQIAWSPDTTPALYTALGLDDAGYPIWVAPSGAHDAYNAGDIVNHNGVLYKSAIDGNTTVPGSDSRYWTIYIA